MFCLPHCRRVEPDNQSVRIVTTELGESAKFKSPTPQDPGLYFKQLINSLSPLFSSDLGSKLAGGRAVSNPFLFLFFFFFFFFFIGLTDRRRRNSATEAGSAGKRRRRSGGGCADARPPERRFAPPNAGGPRRSADVGRTESFGERRDKSK